MAVVEVGTFNIRSGYVGDIACTRRLPSLRCSDAPEETDFVSMMIASSATGGDDHQNRLSPLWSLRSLQNDCGGHASYLRNTKSLLLGCAVSDPLMLVVPEVWHERLDVMRALFEMVLEDGGIASSMYCMRPSVGWALAAGKASAVVLDVGHSHTTVTAVLDGFALRQTVDSAAVGGAAVTAQFEAAAGPIASAIMTAAYPELSQHPEARRYLLEDHISDIKHLVGYVSSSASPPPLRSLRTPDGAKVHFTQEQRCGPFELFFSSDPQLRFNVADMLITCKNRIDPEWRLQTVHHVLGGAGSLVPGFKNRVVRELTERDSAYVRYARDQGISLAKSEEDAWMGASIAASSSSFAPLWVSKADWEEEGESVLSRKIFY